MNRFFAIIKGSIPFDEHPLCWQRFQSRFPKQFSTGSFHSGSLIEIWGDFHRATGTDGQELYLVGEIYEAPGFQVSQDGINYQELTNFLLSAIINKGWSSLDQLNGRFTLIYMQPGQQVVSVRSDHMGIQQCYYHQGRDFLLLGSEIKYFFNHPLCPSQIDWVQSLKRPIPFVVLDGERNYNAWFKGIDMLQEGHQMDYDRKKHKLTTVRYWDPYKSVMNNSWNSSRQIMESYMELLDDSVRIRLGNGTQAYSFLSGGLDSSVICALANKYKALDTFSIVSQTTLLEGTSDFCDRLAKDLNFNNKQFLIPYNNLLLDVALWKKRIWRAESPYAHTDSLTKTLLHYAIGKYHGDVPYVLTGTGSDQLNGGLTRWIVNDPENAEEKWPQLAEAIYREEIKNAIQEKHPVLFNCKHYFRKNFISSLSEYQLEPVLFHYYLKSNVYINQFTLQWDENRAASHHKRSVRYPFLDYRFLPFIAGIPEEFHKDLFYDKEILRHPGPAYLPDYILNKPKAPALTGPYDKRAVMYRFLLEQDNHKLIAEALEKNSDIIDIDKLLLDFEEIKYQNQPVKFEYLMHVINLGLLELLPGQDESELDMETDLDAAIEMMYPWSAASAQSCKNKLNILEEADMLELQLSFAPQCSVVQDILQKKFYIVKDEILIYELDESQQDWFCFINHIDNLKSCNSILSELDIHFESIRDHFYLCIREKILQLSHQTS
ncbi:MAG: hypothetical protein IPM34_01290 [Saprospiraceae bacterium]|nr:hypothetical protein [Saprospiraceae bacterium]